MSKQSVSMPQLLISGFIAVVLVGGSLSAFLLSSQNQDNSSRAYYPTPRYTPIPLRTASPWRSPTPTPKSVQRTPPPIRFYAQ